MTDKQYSVSLPRQRRSTGPKPMEKRSTPTPTQRATRKWPSSWMRMRMPMTMTNDRTVVTATSFRPARRPPARLGGDGDAGLDGLELAGRNVDQRVLDEFGNVRECDAAIEKGRDRDLVRSIEHDRGRPALLESVTGQPEAREARGIRLEEGELAHASEIEARGRGGPPLRVRERIEDGHAHVGDTELGDDGAVDVLDHRVHDRLRVHDDLDLFGRDVEEPARLDDLEALVHQRGRVDRDLGAHLPRRMAERIVHGDRGELLLGQLAERPARRREQDAVDVAAIVAAQALED